MIRIYYLNPFLGSKSNSATIMLPSSSVTSTPLRANGTNDFKMKIATEEQVQSNPTKSHQMYILHFTLIEEQQLYTSPVLRKIENSFPCEFFLQNSTRMVLDRLELHPPDGWTSPPSLSVKEEAMDRFELARCSFIVTFLKFSAKKKET